MGELREGARFAVKPITKLRIGREGFRQDLDRDGAIQTSVAGFVDLAHAAGADGGLDFVRAEARAGRKSHRFELTDADRTLPGLRRCRGTRAGHTWSAGASTRAV